MSSSLSEDKPKYNDKVITYGEIGRKLLEDKLYLTALEFYTESLECGKDVKELKDFFANPGNFEQQIHDFSSRLSRSGSQITLDSLDLTRYSEDGERGIDEKIAVLEFELRKAKETINALRNNLTVATESESNAPTQLMHNVNIMPHEKRALNFLINEYLLSYGYKLTSITFADENEDQDFDDWDDVGLNIPKPIGLLGLYREGLKRTGCNAETVCCQTNFTVYYEHDIEKYVKQIAEFNLRMAELQNKLQDIQEENKCLVTEDEIKSKINQENVVVDVSPIVVSSKSSTTSSATPECFEIITTEDSTSVSSLNDQEWIKLEENKVSQNDNKRHSVIDLFHQKLHAYFSSSTRKISSNWEAELFSFYPVNIPRKSDNTFLENIAQLTYSFDSLVQTVSNTLQRIIPNVLLNKRDDLVALLVSVICINNNNNVRDKLLQHLFNLKKKPTSVERSLILAGIIKIANHLPQDVVESELLSLCCEQLSNKHKEKRLLICETCIVLVPYISTSMRHSLLFSILQQMSEDSDESVRILVVKAISLVAALCDDMEKYAQCLDFSLKFINDECDNVFQITLYVLYPILAEWGLHNGTFEILFKKLFNFQKQFAGNDLSIMKIYKILNHLLPFVLVFVCNTDVVCKEVEDTSIDINPEIINICSKMNNPQIFYRGVHGVGVLVDKFQNIVENSDNGKWDELNWTLTIISDLINTLDDTCIRNENLFSVTKTLFSNLCLTFGKIFTKKFIRPIFEENIKFLTQNLSTVHAIDLNFVIVPIYLVSVLSYCDDKEEILLVLKKFSFAIPLSGMSVLCLETSIKELCNNDLQETVLNCLWDAVVHQQPIVRANAGYLFKTIIPLCNGNLLYSKVLPALVTLANDPDMSVRIQIVPAVGFLITECDIRNIHDKAYMLLQSFFLDLNYSKNHALLKQLITTLGIVSTNCSEVFLYDVVITQLSNITNHIDEIENIQRLSEIIMCLKEAFASIVYSNINNKTTSSVLLPSLRYLESIITENPNLYCHKEVIISMVKECENRLDITMIASHSQKNLISDNVNTSMEEMRNRMSKMFNKTALPNRNSLSNVQSFFKKK